MTTKVVIACPDNSIHDVLVYVETRTDTDVDAEWIRSVEPVVIKPREQSEPIYLTAVCRVVLEEAARAEVAT